jgi:hypothetical protein
VTGIAADVGFQGGALHRKISDRLSWGRVGRLVAPALERMGLGRYDVAAVLAGRFLEALLAKGQKTSPRERAALILPDLALGKGRGWKETIAESLRAIIPADADPFQTVQLGYMTDWVGNRMQGWTDVAAAHGHAHVYPFLDSDLIQYLVTLPLDVLFKGGEVKYLERRMLESYVPLESVKSQAIRLPLDRFLRTECEALRDELLDKNGPLSSCLRLAPVGRWLDEHARGRDRVKKLWPIVILSRWLGHRR